MNCIILKNIEFSKRVKLECSAVLKGNFGYPLAVVNNGNIPKSGEEKDLNLTNESIKGLYFKVKK